jgi:ELP3 family radical SAM enzyme/protein acetyltransferase
MRGLSGVIVISVITSPYPEFTNKKGETVKQGFSCKHDCFYCPKEVDENGKEINPRSYLSDEPTVARGLQNNFDAVDQFNDRAFQYMLNGHYVDKIEIIVLGGTWTEYPREYQETFIRDIFWSANTFYSINKREKLTLGEEQKINETAPSRIIGLTLEMRPDSIHDEEIQWLRYLGCTRVQLGVQHIDRKILKKVNRGCYVEDAMAALQKLKNYGYKVDAHWMPDLPGSSPDIDKRMFDTILDTSTLQFDQWKVYPTSVVPWTKIKKWHEEGTYVPYTDEDPEKLINVLLHVKNKVHPWIRLNRVVRDIPNYTRDGVQYIYGGNKVTNLRQILHDRLKKCGQFCRCIRCREVKKNMNMIHLARPVVRTYTSSGGTEYFISIESGNSEKSTFVNGKWYNYEFIEEAGIMYGFLRLRLCDNTSNDYLHAIKNCGLIRELHVYGQVVTTNANNKLDEKAQNNGFGRILMKTAENICIKKGYNSIAVISGIGVKNYYRKLGYEEKDTYMIKHIYWLQILKTHLISLDMYCIVGIILAFINYLYF